MKKSSLISGFVAVAAGLAVFSTDLLEKGDLSFSTAEAGRKYCQAAIRNKAGFKKYAAGGHAALYINKRGDACAHFNKSDGAKSRKHAKKLARNKCLSYNAGPCRLVFSQ